MKNPEAVEAFFESIAEKLADVAMNFGAGALDDFLLGSTLDEILMGMPTPAELRDEIIPRAREIIMMKIEAKLSDAN